ncbi:MAG: helix-turn-helix domain-containing protein [SAR324 cluster bacterium]|nr:helix-turn-helix domain-containing protein [SAR324 cluster bacterium]
MSIHHKECDNYYQVLNVPTDATTEEIRKAYKEASEKIQANAEESHSSFANEENEQILRNVTKAYMVLVDPPSRAQHDTNLKQQQAFSPPRTDDTPGKKFSSIETSKNKSDLLGNHLAQRSEIRNKISQKNKISLETVNDFLTSVEHYNGKILQEIRKIKSIELEEIAQETCIRQTYLVAIENDDYLKLPSAAVYVRSFVNNYARCLDLPVEKVTEDYIQNFKQHQQPKQSKGIF